MIGLRLAMLHLRVAAMNELQYRVNFFIQLVHSGLQLATGLIAIGLVFEFTTDLAGWSRGELLAVMGVHILLGGVVRALIQPNMQELMYGIERGEFDFVLTKPIDAQVLVSVRRAQVWHLVDVAVGATVIVWAVQEIGRSVGLVAGTWFAVTVLCGGVILYALWIMITSTAFKWVRVEEMIQLMTGTFEAGRWPVTIYPGWLRGVLTYVVPLAFAITVPAQALSARLSAAAAVATVLVAVVAMVAARLAWRIGVRGYSGASS